MALDKYKEKRNFKKTPEPAANKNPKEGALKFVIQRHAATRLHYDFRLELEGVLKSWAVPKGPSMNPGDKRLAMMVEDHPFDYRTFEGVIPEGNYGAGIVEIWDEGTYHSLDNEDRKKSEKLLLEGIEKGSLKFTMYGRKLKGEFALVKLKKDTKQDNAWLLIKHRDEYAVEDSEDHVAKNSPINAQKEKKTTGSKSKDRGPKSNRKSTNTGNPDFVAADSKVLKIPGKQSAFPHNLKPMLAKVKQEAFDGEDWIFEIKWDGYRAVTEIEKGKVKMYSRNLLSFNAKYPELIEALQSFGHDVVLDGEVVVLDKNGQAHFNSLQKYEEKPMAGLCYYIFDMLFLNGNDLTGIPLLERKELLKSILPVNHKIRYSDHIEAQGKAFFAQVAKQKLEGILAKKASSPYRIAGRSGEWLKIKTQMRQEAIIAGFTAPKNSRKYFGSLVLGVYDKGTLIHVGQSGGGFDQKSLEKIHKLLEPLVTSNSPFAEKVKALSKITYVKPELVCEIAFSEWTPNRHMRHPVFQGLRDDKNPKDVKIELEEADENKSVEPEFKSKKAKSSATLSKEKKVKKVEKQEVLKEEKPETKVALNAELSIDKHKLNVTNLNKVYWPDEGFTKGDLITYYRQMSPYLLPYLKDRPENLNRHPGGINGPSFYHKNMEKNIPAWIKTQPLYSESSDAHINYMICQNEATLVYMANLGCIEINPWNSRIQSIENPDYIVIDLDPSDGNTFEDVITTAQAVKEVLDKANIIGYPKTSGSSGIHIYIPLAAKYDYEEAKNFAHVIASLSSELVPKITTLERALKARKANEIYVDFLQNRGGQTLAAVYSVRPKPGATVSMPLHWEEVKSGLHPSQFHIKNAFGLIEKRGDLFQPVLGKGVDIMKALKRLGG